MSESPAASPSKLIPREQEGDEEHFVNVDVRVVKRGKDFLVDTRHLKRVLTPKLIKLS